MSEFFMFLCQSHKNLYGSINYFKNGIFRQGVHVLNHHCGTIIDVIPQRNYFRKAIPSATEIVPLDIRRTCNSVRSRHVYCINYNNVALNPIILAYWMLAKCYNLPPIPCGLI